MRMNAKRSGSAVVGLVASLLLAGCVAVDVEHREAGAAVDHYTDPGIAQMKLPFSSAVKTSDTIYLAGEIGIDPEAGKIVPGGAGPETAQVFANMTRTLANFDADLSDIVKCTVFIDDMAHYGEMNAAYAAALPDPKPARSTVAVKGLAVGASLEIECIAVTG